MTDAPKTRAVIFDIDGTLADCSHRRHHLLGPKKKDWEGFYSEMDADEPVQSVIDLTRLFLTSEYQILICTGRPSNYRLITTKWLTRHFVPYRYLYMRNEGDKRDDVIVKREMLQTIRAAGFDPIIAVDDRNKVVRMWREEGLTCLQCAEGDF